MSRSFPHKEWFQSLIGRLQTSDPTGNRDVWVEFQSLIGRLQTYLVPGDSVDPSMFQSLIGRLQTV